MKKQDKILFTCGDVNGIGTEISLKLFYYLQSKRTKYHLIFFCPANVFRFYYESLPLKFKFKKIDNIEQSEPDLLNLFEMSDCKVEIGLPTAQSGKSAYDSLLYAIEHLKKKKSSVVITAPVSKYAINLAGIEFTGQTELFAKEFEAKEYLMMFLSRKMKAALHTIHIPLKEVHLHIKKSKMKSKLNLLAETLQKDFRIKKPSIAVLGMNPHAGENGKIGTEEVRTMSDLINSLDFAKGPFVSDAFFGNHLYKYFDAVYGMYHDQILIPFKMMNFSQGVNYTAGLPIVRTSPDHGTAFDIAGKNRADFTSILAAYRYAIQILNARKKVERQIS